MLGPRDCWNISRDQQIEDYTNNYIKYMIMA